MQQRSTPRFTALGLALSTAALAFGATGASAADKVKVGFVSTLSGPSSALGVDIRDGFLLATGWGCRFRPGHGNQTEYECEQTDSMEHSRLPTDATVRRHYTLRQAARLRAPAIPARVSLLHCLLPHALAAA